MNAVLKEKYDLPDGWKLKPIGEIVQPTRPRISPSEKPELQFLGMDHIEAHTMRLLGSVPANTMKSSAVHFQPGDVLYGRLRPYLNKVFQPHFEGLCSAEFIVFPETDELDNKYLQYFLNSSTFVRHATSLNSGDRPRVKFEQLAPYEIPLPPTVEQQKRIVAKIEELFSHIDAGIEALKKAKQLLKQYRQTVLKAAVTGELTKEWRDAQGSANAAGGRKPGAATKECNKFETAQELLERIVKERRQKWEEQQLEQFKAKGKMPKDDRWKENYKEPDLSADSENAVDGWLTCRLDVIADVLGGYAFKSKEFSETGHQIVKMANIKMDILDLDSRPSFIGNVPDDIVEKYQIANGDILVTLTGTRKKRDYGYVVRIENSNKSILLNQRIARLRPYFGEFSRYISLYLQSEEFRSEFFSYETGNVGQGNVGIKAVTEVLITLPSTEEQAEIIRKHDSILDAMLRLKKDIDSQLAKVELNKQSILASAFTGNLQ